MQATKTSSAVSAEQLAEQMLAVMHRVMRGGGQAFALMNELELTLTHLKLLTLLDMAGGEQSVKELAETLGLSLPGASRAVDALQRRGWLDRREDERDRRMKLITVTDAGRDVLRQVEEARLVGLRNVTAQLTEDERAALSSALTPLIERTGP